MLVIPLQSGSNGNCTYVEADGVRLLFDAGISGRKVEQRLSEHGRDVRDVHALLISHDHVDHIGHAGVLSRKFGIPVWATPRTLWSATMRMQLGELGQVHHFAAGATLRFGGVTVESVCTPHDAVDGVAFVISSEGKRFGLFTDLGHPFRALRELMGAVDGLLLESNHDPGMLARGGYPAWLQQRIRGPKGHLSNEEAACLVRDHAGPRLQWLCLGHLSEHNNSPELALQTHRTVLGSSVRIHVARRQAGSQAMQL